MNPIALPIAELKAALTGIGKVLNTKATLPVLHHVKVERTSDGWIAITGTDLDRFVTLRLEHPAEGPPVAVLVPYDHLLQFSKNCSKEERLLIETTPEGTVIKFALANNLGASKVKPFPVDQFPQVPRIKTEAVPLPPAVRESLHQALECASSDETRYILNGAFIDASNPKAFNVVGTDGKHLYSANSFTLPIKLSVLIPSHKFLQWKEFNQDGEWQMKADSDNIQLSSRRWRFITRQIQGKYPNWRQTVPNPADDKTHITLDPSKLETLIKLVQRIPCHDPDRYQTIGLEWRDGQFLLLGKDSDNEPWTRVPVSDVQAKGPEMSIFLSRRFLIKAFGYGMNTISLVDSMHPLRFHTKAKQMIVMPLRMDSGQPQTQQPKPVNIPAPRLHVPPPKPTPMITNPTSEGPAPSNDQKTPVEEAIDMTLIIRDKFNEGFNLLRDLSLKLKGINRDQKASAREMQSVRSTLRSIQGMKI
ncbi:DNA polymerase III subunit beta [Prosthecobacter sp.]|jgi:DNA polymerase III sliding clamp (beta) subunit (PCNA family)|uniref:DNA polymerase III subunit beta n=1 Tax=Prosthecobacter sp. TaxID=1965333 RepID=UPI0037C64609